MYNYVLEFFFKNREMLFMVDSKLFVSYFYNYNKNLFNKFEFFKKLIYLFFLKLC